MTIVSVEVPDAIASGITSSVVDFDTLEDMMYKTVVDFGPNGVGKVELDEYFSHEL